MSGSTDYQGILLCAGQLNCRRMTALFIRQLNNHTLTLTPTPPRLTGPSYLHGSFVRLAEVEAEADI